jgi:hypothetical protein
MNFVQQIRLIQAVHALKERIDEEEMTADLAGQACVIIAAGAALSDGLTKEQFVEACEISFEQLSLAQAEQQDKTGTFD